MVSLAAWAWSDDVNVRRRGVASASARERRRCADEAIFDMCDSLRRYKPDQVLRDSLSLRPTWAGTPVTEGI
jgi:hypothetical protein